MLTRRAGRAGRVGRVGVRRSSAVVLVGAVALLLSGCSGGGDDPVPDEDTVSVSTPAPGDLTAPGTALSVGDAAIVDDKAGGPRQESKVRVLVRAVDKGKVKDLSQFELNDAARSSTVYYVRATVTNLGHGDLGGSRLALYAKVSDSLVVQPVVFGSTFGKCDYRPLPKPFRHGKKADVCMVLLAPKHGTVSEIQWRFAGDDAPISWSLP